MRRIKENQSKRRLGLSHQQEEPEEKLRLWALNQAQLIRER
jgi:hypothetical protein